MRTRSQRKAKNAFTLIEILIVVVILGILAAIVIPQFAESADSAKENAAKSTLQTVRSQVQLYQFKVGSVPTFDNLVTAGYLTEWNQPDGYCISINDTTGAVSMATGDCPE